MKVYFLEKMLTSENSNFAIDLDGSTYFHFRRNVYFSGAKEVQNFNVKVHGGAAGCVGPHSDKNREGTKKF